MSVLDREAPRRLLAQAGVAAILAALADEDEETRLVGGCVRDALLGRDSHDIDLTTTLLPERVIALAKRAGLRSVPTGIEHGTVTLLAAGRAFEVTTLREDVETDGRHAVVRFGRDFALDAQRRDFTINALSLDTTGHIHDVTRGVADLENGHVRFIGEAETRIREDALRILRFFRFHARYGRGAPDPDGLAACIAARALLDALSRERVRSELLRLMQAPGVREAVAILSNTGLLMRLIGGIGDLGRLSRIADTQAGADDIARLAGLAMLCTEDAERLRAGLRLSKAEHAQLLGYGRALDAIRSRERIDGTEMRRLAAVLDLQGLTRAVAATDGEPTPRITAEAIASLEAFGTGAATIPVFPLAGADLIDRGVPAGSEIGRRLAVAKALWLAQGCPESEAAREALLERATV